MTGAPVNLAFIFLLCAAALVSPIRVHADSQAEDPVSSPVFEAGVDKGTADIDSISAPVADSSSSSATAEDASDKSNIIDVSHKTISENIIGFSHTVDSYFSNQRILDESSGSYGCIRTNVFFSEGGEIETNADVCLKIDLPHTKKRWKLIFESDEVEQVVDGEQSQGTETAGVNDNQDRSSSATLRYVFEEELLKHINFDIGVKTRTPLDPFTRLRFRRTWVPDPWLFRLTESLYYFKSTEGGFLSRLDMERKFGHEWFARMTTEADYRDVEQEFNLSQSFGFYHRVGKGRALSLELAIIGDSQPNPHVEYYVYRFRYRINLWRDWFFVEVSPQLLYQRETDFDQEAGILFAAEAIFGNQ